MKLKIDTVHVVATELLLKAIATAAFLGGENRYMGGNIYVFYLNAVTGTYKPDNDNNGYWEKNNKKASDYISVVADNYDFVTNNATDITNLSNWKTYWQDVYDIKAFRDVMIADYIGTWGTLTDDEKKILIEFHVWPLATPDVELDALYDDDTRDGFLSDICTYHRGIGCVITNSTTPASKKRINWTADDLEVADPKVIEPHLSIE